MKILITGASGYLGSQLVKALSNYHDVIALVRSSSSLERLTNLDISVKVCSSDVQLAKVFEEVKPELVINTVALYGRNNEEYSKLVYANIQYPTELLDLCIKYKTKALIHTGTSLPDDVSAYAFTKNTFVNLNKKRELLETKFINIELEHFYGPGDDLSKFISHVVNKCLNNENLQLTSGTQQRDFIYIDDVISAYKFIISKIDNFKQFESIPLGTGTAPTIKSVVESIHSISNSRSELTFGAIPMREHELMHSCADLSLLNALGWKVENDLNSGLYNFVNISKEK